MCTTIITARTEQQTGTASGTYPNRNSAVNTRDNRVGNEERLGKPEGARPPHAALESVEAATIIPKPNAAQIYMKLTEGELNRACVGLSKYILRLRVLSGHCQWHGV